MKCQIGLLQSGNKGIPNLYIKKCLKEQNIIEKCYMNLSMNFGERSKRKCKMLILTVKVRNQNLQNGDGLKMNLFENFFGGFFEVIN